jgi:hypothetical protein
MSVALAVGIKVRKNDLNLLLIVVEIFLEQRNHPCEERVLQILIRRDSQEVGMSNLMFPVTETTRRHMC